MAHKTGALATRDLERVAVDTTVQPKNVAFPTDARLMHKAIVMLARLARDHDVPLRQSYVRVAKRAALMAGRYAPHQFNGPSSSSATTGSSGSCAPVWAG